MVNIEHYFRSLVEGKSLSTTDRLVLSALKLCSFPYSLVLRLRASAYAAGIFRSLRLPKPVISVGNLTVGGTGKTPMVAWLASLLMGQGKRVVVLSRGYGGSAEGQIRVVSDGNEILLSAEEAGDEPVLLARNVPGLLVVTGTDRYRAGLHALEKLRPDIFILDDGFQHLRLKRDLNILLLDGKSPFGNGYTLPAGFLREPISAAGRADIVVYTRCPEGPLYVPAVSGKPSCTSTHNLTGLVPFAGGETVPFSFLQGMRVTAFSGIADSAAFFDALEKVGVQLTATLAFPDHTTYGDKEMAALSRLKTASRSTVLVTTAKDAVKLTPYLEQLGCCYTAAMEIVFHDSAPLEHMLEKIL